MNDIDAINEKYVNEISDAEEIDLMSDNECNVRDYKEGDFINLKKGGEGRILKIVYVVKDNDDDIQFLHKCDLGNQTTKEF